MTLKPVYSATSYNIDILHVVSLDIILSKERIIKALTSLSGCAGRSAPLLLACNKVRFSLVETMIIGLMLNFHGVRQCSHSAC